MLQSKDETSIASLIWKQKDGTFECEVSGAWTVSHIERLEQIKSECESARVGKIVRSMGLSGITHVDTYGAVLLERIVRILGLGMNKPESMGLPYQFCALYEQVARSKKNQTKRDEEGNILFSSIEGVGRSTTNFIQDLRSLLEMVGSVCTAFLRVFFHLKTFRFTSTIHHIDRVAWQAVPIILLITFLIGGIIAQQGIFHFRKFGADVYVVDMVGILILREIGVLIVAIMVAGRSGSSYTAELGSMKMREEIDALQTMGLSPIEILILPRIVALIVALPILTFIGSMSALYGGQLVAWLYGGMSPEIFVQRLKEAISLTHFKVGMIKAPFMAFVIGIVSCTQGLQVKGSAESLGLQTTASVVKSIFLVIVMDGLFAVFFASIDM